MHIFAFLGYLVGRFHHGIELCQGDWHETGMCDPGSVMPIGGFALLVGTYTREGFFVSYRVTFNRDLSRHAADSWRVTVMAGFDRKLSIGTHKRCGHCNLY